MLDDAFVPEFRFGNFDTLITKGKQVHALSYTNKNTEQNVLKYARYQSGDRNILRQEMLLEHGFQAGDICAGIGDGFIGLYPANGKTVYVFAVPFGKQHVVLGARRKFNCSLTNYGRSHLSSFPYIFFRRKKGSELDVIVDSGTNTGEFFMYRSTVLPMSAAKLVPVQAFSGDASTCSRSSSKMIEYGNWVCNYLIQNSTFPFVCQYSSATSGDGRWATAVLFVENNKYFLKYLPGLLREVVWNGLRFLVFCKNFREFIVAQVTGIKNIAAFLATLERAVNSSFFQTVCDIKRSLAFSWVGTFLNKESNTLNFYRWDGSVVTVMVYPNALDCFLALSYGKPYPEDTFITYELDCLKQVRNIKHFIPMDPDAFWIENRPAKKPIKLLSSSLGQLLYFG